MNADQILKMVELGASLIKSGAEFYQASKATLSVDDHKKIEMDLQIAQRATQALRAKVDEVLKNAAAHG